MARHYSTKSFFRNAPNALLARYFSDRDVLTDFDFSTLKEGNPDPLFSAWLDLDETIRGEIDTDFQEIFALSCEKGTKAIIDEAGFHSPGGYTAFSEWLAGKKNHYEKAFAVFLDFSNYWHGAALFFHADGLSYWRKRKNFPQCPAQCDEGSLNHLAQLISNYFHYTEGKGRNCLVEPLRRNDLDYFFAYPEDYSQRSVEWVKGEFKPRPHNPAFEIIFVYSQRKGTLDLHYSGNYKAVEPMQVFFAKAVLGIEELEPMHNDHRIYDLNPLLNADFDFLYAANSGILDVGVSNIRLTSKIKKGERVTLEADCQTDAQAIYKLLDSMASVLPLKNYYATRVEFVASVALSPDKLAKTFRFAVTYPNSCSLKYEAEHLVLRGMLEQSGIEPKDAAETEELDF
jgi:hypothetical protein